MLFPHIIDYSLCQQTVTVYHQEDGAITRTVHEKAFFDFNKTLNVAKTGASDASGFLLVIPGDTQTVFPGDKVVLGVGEEVPADVTRWWARFIPSKVPNMGVVKHADPKYWNGVLIHTEAGG